jgi:hypothetical protein
LKNSCGEVLKIKLVTYEPSRDFHNARKTYEMQAAAFSLRFKKTAARSGTQQIVPPSSLPRFSYHV